MNTFKELGLKDSLVAAVTQMGFVNPMPIQEKIIPLLLQDEPEDIIALAQTGTGKTTAFGLPLIQKVETELKKVQYVIICPTRELCIQFKAQK